MGRLPAKDEVTHFNIQCSQMQFAFELAKRESQSIT